MIVPRLAPVFTRPPDLPDAAIVDALATGWNLGAADVAEVTEVTYAPVGFGSHHWWAVAAGERWFVTLDDLDARRRNLTDGREHAASRLSAALRTARALRDAGHEFVIAPLPTVSGEVGHRIGDRYLAAVYEHVDGITHGFGKYESPMQRLAVLDRLVALHGASACVHDIALADDFVVPSRDQLSIALTDTGVTWGPGPFAEPASQLLKRYATDVSDTLARYDALVVEVQRSTERFVITHGEPHRANTIDTAAGVVLIDWDTTLLAPPERDLWMLLEEDSLIAEQYTARTCVAVEPEVVQLYRLWWDLCEIALYTAELRAAHIDSDDTVTAWRNLCTYLDPNRWKT